MRDLYDEQDISLALYLFDLLLSFIVDGKSERHLKRGERGEAGV